MKRSAMLFLLVLVATLGARASDTLEARSQYQSMEITRVAGGLEHPWALAFLPDGAMLVTEKPGRLKLIDDGGAREITGLPDDLVAIRQGGLLDVVPHPNYVENGWIYFTYSQGDTDATATTLFRARLDGDRLVDREQLFTQDRRSRPGGHYGSRLAFLPDGTLLMSIGDRAMQPARAQDLDDHAGTLLRLNDDGSVPADNPFLGRDDALPEIYSYGHRNIQGLIVHPRTGEIWATEHGPRGGDELNRVEAGMNYGWPAVTRGLDYRTQGRFGDSVRGKEGMVDPVIDWTPALAPSGLAYLEGDGWAPQWAGNLFAGGLRAEEVRRVVFDNGEVVHEEALLQGVLGRIRDVRGGPDGYLYLVTDHQDGAIYRIRPAP